MEGDKTFIPFNLCDMNAQCAHVSGKRIILHLLMLLFGFPAGKIDLIQNHSCHNLAALCAHVSIRFYHHWSQVQLHVYFSTALGLVLAASLLHVIRVPGYLRPAWRLRLKCTLAFYGSGLRGLLLQGRTWGNEKMIVHLQVLPMHYSTTSVVSCSGEDLPDLELLLTTGITSVRYVSLCARQCPLTKIFARLVGARIWSRIFVISRTTSGFSHLLTLPRSRNSFKLSANKAAFA